MAQLELTWRMPSTEPDQNWEQNKQDIATATTLPTHYFTTQTTFKCTPKHGLGMYSIYYTAGNLSVCVRNSLY